MASQPPYTSPSPAQEADVSSKTWLPKRRGPDYRHIHRFPLPLQVHHPLPPLIPHNPLSVISVLLSYLTYYITTPHNDTYSAYFDSNTSSVHITDEMTVRALWDMGFFGKGSLSRSEPTWLDQEKKRRGLLGGVTSEELTRQRRAERRELKLQRARSEKLIIEQRLQAEAAAREGHTSSGTESAPTSSIPGVINGTALTPEKFSVTKAREARFLEAQKLAEREREASSKTVSFSPTGDGKVPTLESLEHSIADGHDSNEETTITNEEHLQLSNEEAFFLVYGLGTLHIFDHDQKSVLSPDSLLRLFCHHSYSPPREPSMDLKPDDPFLVSYVVYHHFRSLGWVVRSGVKFGVDYMIYNRGPVFAHAEFAVVVIPSYDHRYWSETEERKAECASKQAHSWWWLHCINRVQAQVKKTLVVCYVEIPPPSQDLQSASASRMDIGALLTRYRDDSIDIARLQRVALGLESPQGRHDLVPLPHPDDPAVIFGPQDGPREALLYGASPGGQYNTTGSLNRNRHHLMQRTSPSSSVPQTPKMGSAGTLPSDTQVVSQSLFDEIIRQNKESSKDGPDSNVIHRATPLTLHVGDSGHIDLLAGFDGTNAHAPNTDENDDQSSSKLSESSPLTYQPNLFPESQRFVAKTPTTATEQPRVEAVSTVSPLVSRNPLAPDLESDSGVMALSQVFKATQAPSSPLVNGLQSDFMSDKPSPNIPIQHRPRAPFLSSPFNTISATFPRDSSEIQLNYVTKNESQANRQERMTRSADHIYSEDQSDSEFDKVPSFIERSRRRNMIDQEAAPQLAAVSAHARPGSRRDMRTGLSGAPERRDSTDGSTVVISGESRRPTPESHAVGMSEEETEQEEELPEPVARSHPPNSSTEEDKENCNDPSMLGLSHTASAHDRLSQALSFHESPPAVRNPHQALPTAHPHPRSQDLDGGAANTIRSSPITVVKDSQWSPGRNDEEQGEQQIAESPSSHSQTQPGARIQTVIQERGTSSPTRQLPLQPPTQGSQHYIAPSHGPSASAISRPGWESKSSARSSNLSRDGTPSQQASNTLSNNPLAPDHMEDGSRAPTFDPRSKSSSMPSRVAETPVHQRQRSSHDLPTFATIPETSPNNMNHEGWMSDSNNEIADQEDDDLPPLHPSAFGRASQSRPVVTDTSSPNKPLLNSKILSSPSGRQRRALTEIAADASPQVGGATFDVNINILSADDQEFRSAVAMSPIPVHKKRRGNDGRNIPASDPIVPVTPRQPSQQLIPPQEEGPTAAPSLGPTEAETRRQTTFQGRAKPQKRVRSIWDTEDSPKFRVSNKERSKIFARSQAREQQPSQTTQSSQTAQPSRAREHKQKGISSPGPIHTDDVADPDPAPVAPTSEPVVEENLRDEYRQPSMAGAPIAPKQVLAPWRGQKRAYYPATYIGKPFGTTQDQYLVKFEDSAPVEVPTGTVKKLELRIGDAVKVDMPKVPKVTHIIRGFADKLNADELSSEMAKGVIPVTDIYGYSTLLLGPKQRRSLPNGGLADPENVIKVPISRIYLDTILWNQLKDRPFTYSSGSGSSESRLQTPSDRHSTPISPSTRLSRSFYLPNGLFSGMVFAVSYGDKSDAKYRITKMILENDGRILEDGFNELFELPLNTPVAKPVKSPSPGPTGLNFNLRLRRGAEEVGFACLIADKHSRRPKYMQALALNLPCLSDRWIEDCVANGQVLDWEMYLLPAGESSYLNGATKSRILAPYPATKAKLSETVAVRPNLLNGQSVLLITGRNGKTDEERRKAYIFLTYALGASRIERVPDIKSARAVLNQARTGQEANGWDWVYIDDDDKVTKAAAAGNSLPSNKRRKSKLTEPFNGDDLGLGNNVRVVGNEFVCQSLILGRLVD
ncbi:uncharacterized protein BJX67DRAFT_390622 [Aspergillus lucknowensis]|uniref:tRNA-intron lyase n=1 Tax=Aspergillus lucknowensis TaxID=176173 RepID=A0ABR4LG29_9EURO